MTPLDHHRHFDLHVHSTASDGRYEPVEVLRRAATNGIDVLALTDHDLATQLPAGEHEIDGHTIHLLGAAELSGLHDGIEYHLLVYFPGEVPADFRAFCEQQSRARAERYEAARESIGLPNIAPADDASVAGQRSLTRHHLARALVDAGHAGHVRQAFQRYASYSHGHVQPVDVAFVDCIRLARAAGGVTSWAHPPLPDVQKHLEVFVEAGLQGLEALRPKVQVKNRRQYARFARKHGLFLTGGSDWHGWERVDLGLFRLAPDQLRGFLDTLYPSASAS